MICPKVPERYFIKIRIALTVSLVFGPTCTQANVITSCQGKCHNELLGKHKCLALKNSYSDEVFLLPARRIPIRIAFHKNSSLKTPMRM